MRASKNADLDFIITAANPEDWQVLYNRADAFFKRYKLDGYSRNYGLDRDADIAVSYGGKGDEQVTIALPADTRISLVGDSGALFLGCDDAPVVRFEETDYCVSLREIRFSYKFTKNAPHDLASVAMRVEPIPALGKECYTALRSGVGAFVLDPKMPLRLKGFSRDQLDLVTDNGDSYSFG